MNRNSVYSCSNCNTLNTLTLNNTSLLACKSCGTILFKNITGKKKSVPSSIPQDWSFLQLGTTGEYNKHLFTVVGRIRVQLRNDYKNFWCAEYENGKSMWIAESFASFSVFAPLWQPYHKDPSRLRAGISFPVTNQLKMKGEYVEKCEGIAFQGEAGDWKSFYPGFFLVQSSGGNEQTAIFFIESKENILFLTGEKVPVEKLNLKNIIEWNEWK